MPAFSLVAFALTAVVVKASDIEVDGHPSLFSDPWPALIAPGADVVADGDLKEWPDAKCFVFWPQMAFKEYPRWCLENWLHDTPFADRDGNATTFETTGSTASTFDGIADFQAAVGFSWDEGNFYVRAHVRDENFQSDCGTGANFWSGDAMRIMITDAARTEVEYMYNVALFFDTADECDVETHIDYEKQPECDDAENEQQACGARDPIQATVSRSGQIKTTNYEVKIPAAWLGVEAFSSGMKFGVAVAMNDGDHGELNGWAGVSPDAIVFEHQPERAMPIELDAQTFKEKFAHVL